MITSVKAQLLLIGLLGFSATSLAQSADQWQFQSTYDQFTIEKQGHQYRLNNEVVSFASFQDFTSLFESDLEGDCSSIKKKPDLTVKRVRGEQVITRKFFLEDKAVGDGQSCGGISGQGVYYLPLHRVWFTGPKTLNLTLGSKLELTLVDGTSLTFAKEDDDWNLTTPDFFVDWNHFDQVVPHWTNFSVHARLHPGVTQGAPSFTLKTNNSQYNFFLVGENLWAIQLPKVRWLVASKDWAILQDMKTFLWKDRHFDHLMRLSDKKADFQQRRSALAELSSSSSKSMRLLLQRIVTDREEPSEIKLVAATQIKQRPSDDNFKALVKGLRATEDRAVMEQFTKVLRVRWPSGPTINDETPDGDVEAAIKNWEDWARKIAKKFSKP